MSKKILLIVEGESTELRVLGKKTHGLLSLVKGEYEVVPYGGSIYELYDEYKKGNYDDTVAYLRSLGKIEISKDVLSKNAYSAIYMFFDFDPHYQKYSDEKILDMMSIFDDETRLGKLYINYPMVEAYYHITTLEDEEFFDRTIDVVDISGKKYKKKVNQETCIKKNSINKKELCAIIWHHWKKAGQISGEDSYDIHQREILLNQLTLKRDKSLIYILATIPFVAIDYNPEEARKLIKREIGKEINL